MPKKVIEPSSPDRPVELFRLEDLEFDLRNPRYGAGAAKIRTETEALDHIVKMFGVSDVLSSIAVNGFFDSEPLVGIRSEGTDKIKIVEGNRRLAACLILSDDARAGGQSRLRDQYLSIYREHGNKRISPVPVIVYKGSSALKDVLPYIGVRHIVGFLEWDSYAKAAWVDNVLHDYGLSLDEVQKMVGDKNGTIPRMLSGYRLVNQLISTGHFRSDQSHRKGRGSNPDYPFSWVYTALDNQAVRDFVGFKETNGVPDETPIPADKLENAGTLLALMFGDKYEGKVAVIEDSREIGDLAKVIRDPLLLCRLKEGKTLRVVIEEARPNIERLQEGFQRVAYQLKDLSGLIVPGILEHEDAERLVHSARLVSSIARKIVNDLRSIALGPDEFEDNQ